MIKINRENLKPSRLYRLNYMLNTFLADNVVLAGGAPQIVIDNAVRLFDFDFFFLNRSAIQPLKDKLEKAGYEKVFECPAGDLTTYKKGTVKVQLITKFIYKSVEELLKSFDFTATMVALTLKNFYTTHEAIKSIKTKLLRLNRLTYPVATLKRYVKYINNKGYRSDYKMTMDMINAINEMELNDDNMIFYVD